MVLPFDNDDAPTTYTELLDFYRDSEQPFNDSSHQHRRMEGVAARLQRFRRSMTTRAASPENHDLLRLLNDLESLGVRGWTRSLQASEACETACDFLDAVLDGTFELENQKWDLQFQMSRLQFEVRDLQVQVVTLERERAMQQQIRQDEKDRRDDDEAIEELQEVVENLEAQIGRLENLRSAGDEPIPTSPRRPTPRSEGSMIVEVDDSADPPILGIGDLSLTGSGSDSGSRSSPQGAARKAQDKEEKSKVLHAMESSLWESEEQERENYSGDNQPPSSSDSNNDIIPPSDYIHICFPAGFVLPSASRHIPSMTFLSAAIVFHFPEGATRDQLGSILRRRLMFDLLMPSSGANARLNIIRVRTHGMECDLKSAIKKTMSREEWESDIGSRWCTLGQGDTYIVSTSDIHFHGIGHSPEVGSNEDGDHAGKDDEDDSKNAREDGEYDKVDGNENENGENGHEHLPHLRGGQGSDSNLAVNDGHGVQDPPDFDGLIEFLRGMSVEDESSFEQAWIEYTRVLQLQNASLKRMIQQLEEIIQDYEETIEWQDVVLERMWQRKEHWKEKAAQAKEDRRAAKENAQQAEAEVKQWRDVVKALVEYEGVAEREEEPPVVANPQEWRGPRAPNMRGGGNSQLPALSPRNSSPVLERDEPAATHLDVGGFYFFPSVSIIVLLTKPLRYFQWPRHTTLAQIRESLEYRHENGVESSPGLSHISDILETRQEMGIPLPDTREQRQVFISIPEVEDAFVADGAGRSNRWEKSFGPDVYETVLEELSNLKEPAASDPSHYSSRSSDEERFDDVGYLINSINDQTSPSIDLSRFPLPPINIPYPYSAEVRNASGGPNQVESSHRRPVFKDPFATPSPRARPTLPPRKRTMPIVPEHPNQPHPACMPEGKLWNVVRYPPNGRERREASDEAYEYPELERSANFDYELGMGGYLPSPSVDGSATGEADEQWARHPKGEGCESWLDQSKLDQLRARCTFCHIPFADELKHDAVLDVREDRFSKAPTPTTRTRRSSPKKTAENSSEERIGDSQKRKEKALDSPCLSPKAAGPRLRGGGGEYIEHQWRERLYHRNHRPTTRYPSPPRFRLPPSSTPSSILRPPRRFHSPKSYKMRANIKQTSDLASSADHGHLAPPNTLFFPKFTRELTRSGPYPRNEKPEDLFKRFISGVEAEDLYKAYVQRKTAYQITIDTYRAIHMQNHPKVLAAQISALRGQLREAEDLYELLRRHRSLKNLAKIDSEHRMRMNERREKMERLREEMREKMEAEKVRLEGPWIPETVAGRSGIRVSEKGKDRNDEYDGMIWGGY